MCIKVIFWLALDSWKSILDSDPHADCSVYKRYLLIKCPLWVGALKCANNILPEKVLNNTWPAASSIIAADMASKIDSEHLNIIMTNDEFEQLLNEVKEEGVSNERYKCTNAYQDA